VLTPLTASATTGCPVRMSDANHEVADNGSVLNIAVAAAMLVLAGLSLMVLDNSLEVVTSAQASIAQQR